MSSTQVRSETMSSPPRMGRTDFKLEVVAIPVTDLERAKRFYTDLGWRLDADFAVNDGWRAIQFTPPGSSCSIHFGKADASGPVRGLFLIVSDIEAARADLVDRGIEVGQVFHRAGPAQPAIDGVDPEHHSYASFVSFSDPDGNSWLLQEVTERFPGRIDDEETRFSSLNDLATALRRAETAHTQHEKATGERDAAWPDWYAEYLINEKAGKPLPI
jgi:catechol 2,3-dioxygenase-like lactoylglutathione lyase family enzyme